MSAPQSLQEVILDYLRLQENFTGNDEGQSSKEVGGAEDEINKEQQVHDMVEQLLLKVNKRIACKDRYENLREWHNQYALFDMEDIIPDFCIDENMMKRLSFKESILISEIDTTVGSRVVTPNPIGSLCLNIQVIEGRVQDEEELTPEEKLEREVEEILRKTHRLISRKPFKMEDVDNEVKKALHEYDKILKEKARYNIKKFVVYLSSEFELNFHGGSSITSWVDRNFHTIEEKRKEWVSMDNERNEKSLYVGLQKDKYYYRYKAKLDNDDKRDYYSTVKMKDYISEGANFILMRYLAIIHYKGTFELSTLYINGGLCRNIYECVGPAEGIIQDTKMQICKIYRYIIEQNGIEHTSVTVLTTNGQIISQEWEGCGVILNRNPLVFMDKSPKVERQILTKSWMDDMKLLSEYLDCKSEAEKKMKTYVSDHPELQHMIGDYLTNMLLLKPENVLHFTTDYFQSICNIDLGKTSYFSNIDYEFD